MKAGWWWGVCRLGVKGTDGMDVQDMSGAGVQLHDWYQCIGEEGVLSTSKHVGGKVLHDQLCLNH
jgi:hypothetical protein